MPPQLPDSLETRGSTLYVRVYKTVGDPAGVYVCGRATRTAWYFCAFLVFLEGKVFELSIWHSVMFIHTHHRHRQMRSYCVLQCEESWSGAETVSGLESRSQDQTGPLLARIASCVSGVPRRPNDLSLSSFLLREATSKAATWG